MPLPKYRSSVVGPSAGDAVAPMPGVVDKVMVNPGDTVEEGQPMLVMIAMKMEVSLPAPQHALFGIVYYHCKACISKITC